MSDLSNVEKRGFERFFGMRGGYVLDFSNRTFEEFILDSTGKEVTSGTVVSTGTRAPGLLEIAGRVA